MNSKFVYKSDSYNRASQRFVVPLYIKNDLDGYDFSSTGTFVKYKNSYFIIFAAHALAGGVDFERVFLWLADGTFFQLKQIAIGHQVFEESDIVIVDTNRVLDGKNYFDLEVESEIGFEKRIFAWTGFPISQSTIKSVHKSKKPEALKEKFVHADESGVYFKNVKYFTILSPVHTFNNLKITGVYDRRNILLKYKGSVSMGPSPKGMSGGAMYFFSKGQVLKQDLNMTFRFAGIGIEYGIGNNIIVGVARGKIIELLNRFDQENPIRLVLAVAAREKLIEVSEKG